MPSLPQKTERIGNVTNQNFYDSEIQETDWSTSQVLGDINLKVLKRRNCHQWVMSAMGAEGLNPR